MTFNVGKWCREAYKRSRLLFHGIVLVPLMECRLTFRQASYLLRVGNMEFLGLAIFVCPLSDSHF
jgi:hypothetical protein